jgi:hypothetical protein
MMTKRLRLGKETLRALQPKDLALVAGGTKYPSDEPTNCQPFVIILVPTQKPHQCADNLGSGICLRSLECPSFGLDCHARLPF